jgi:hypothetical protein
MASSTEEVSGNNETISDRTNQHDTTDTEQKFGMYMREFDFLEYELESLEVCETTFLFNYMFGIYLPGAVEYGYESFGISKRFIVVTGIFESAI